MSHQINRNDPDITIELYCEGEDEPIEGNASAVDDVTDRTVEAWIKAQLEAGNDWAWCTAHVRIVYRNALVGDAYLGACSYESEADFRAGGYFDDMVDEAIAEINRKLVVLCGPPKGSEN